MEVILNTYEFSRETFAICLDTETCQFYIKRVPFWNSAKYRSLDDLLIMVSGLYYEYGSAYYEHMYDAVRKTKENPATAFVIALLLGAGDHGGNHPEHLSVRR